MKDQHDTELLANILSGAENRTPSIVVTTPKLILSRKRSPQKSLINLFSGSATKGITRRISEVQFVNLCGPFKITIIYIYIIYVPVGVAFDLTPYNFSFIFKLHFGV